MIDRGMTGLSRRNLILGALTAPSIVRAQGLTKVKITQPSESLSYMPIYVGRARNFFKEAGIDLELVVTRGDGPDVQALMAKEVEFVATPPHHLYTLYLQNRRLLGVCGILGRCGINMVISKDAAAERNVSENSPFEQKLAALKGLTFGVSTPGSLTYNMGLYYILRAGLKPQVDAKVVGTGVGLASLAAMKNKIANASMFPSPTADEAVHLGFADWLINNTRGQDPDLKEFLHAVIYVRPEFLREYRSLQAHDWRGRQKRRLDPFGLGRRGSASDPAVLRIPRREKIPERPRQCARGGHSERPDECGRIRCLPKGASTDRAPKGDSRVRRRLHQSVPTRLKPPAAKDQEILMGAIEDKIKAMGHTLPEPFKFPKPNRTGCVVVGSIVFVSGHGRYNGPTPGIKTVGKLGRDLTIEEGYATARLAALSILSSLKQELGELERIKRIVRLMGMVNVTPGFDRMPEVIDGASDFFYELLGPKNGQHARTAVGLAELPHGIPVEINGEFELRS
jgi:ABC-type nitrate/sulfonate/bicarbonate transport system substrate-binding protein/enamine deaminase RidA (YjgF/YER057c/UK114 family)